MFHSYGIRLKRQRLSKLDVYFGQQLSRWTGACD